MRDCENKLRSKKFNYVIHLASINETFLPDYPAQAIKVNALGTRNLLEALDKTDLKNFIYFSTVHVYGNTTGSIDENTPPLPLNDYALSHFFAECYVKQFHHAHKLPYTIFRLSNSYGSPKDINTNKWYLLFNDLIKTAYEQKKIILKTNGNPKRDFIWMGDVCEIIHKLLLKGHSLNDTFNLCSGESYKLIEVAKYIQSAYSDCFKELLEIKINTNDVANYDTKLEIAPTKLKKIIPFECKNKFKEETINILSLLQANSLSKQVSNKKNI
jgi:UDP-glucose 4-epimerase